MRTTTDYAISKETLEEQRAAGRYNPGLVLTYRDKAGKHRVPLESGYSDDIEVLREAGLTIVLSINRRMDYLGAQAFEAGEECGNVFFQSEERYREALGPRGLDLAPTTIARYLLRQGYLDA